MTQGVSRATLGFASSLFRFGGVQREVKDELVPRVDDTSQTAVGGTIISYE